MPMVDGECPIVCKFVCELLSNPLDANTTIEDMIKGGDSDPDEEELLFFESEHIKVCERCRLYDEEFERRARNES
jgi:hypothetical protein